MKLRIARAKNNLQRIVEMYSHGLGLKALGSFENHSGYDGVMLGSPDNDYHFEFTRKIGEDAPLSNSRENLVVFYIPDIKKVEDLKTQMIEAGFEKVKSQNPYWDQHGYTFEDFEKYRVVLCHREWTE